MALSRLPEAALPCLLEIELDITFQYDDINIDMDEPHPLTSRLQSVIFHFNEPRSGIWIGIGSLRPCLPWSQLRNLDFGVRVEDPELIFGILRQTPVLEALALIIHGTRTLEQVTMPLLQNLTLEIDTVMYLMLLRVVNADIPDFTQSRRCEETDSRGEEA